MTKKLRNSNLELLRIISMLLIVGHHYATYGMVIVKISNPVNQYITGLLHIGGKIGVCVFIFISAYFMSKSEFTVKKLLRIIGTTWFYSIGIFALFCFILPPALPITAKDLIKSFLPIGSSLYWFMTSYIFLMIISPILNQAIENISRSKLRSLLILGLVFWSIIPSLTNITYGFESILWFAYLYIVAGYIRKYAVGEKLNSIKHLGLSAISYGLILLSAAALIFAGNHVGSLSLIEHSTHFSALNSPLVLFAAVELFLGFLYSKPKHNKFINFTATAMLGVYLIHDNAYARPYIWNNILNCSEFRDSPYLFVHAVVAILLVFVSCVVIDIIRQYTVEKLWMKLVDKILDLIEKHKLK